MIEPDRDRFLPPLRTEGRGELVAVSEVVAMPEAASTALAFSLTRRSTLESVLPDVAFCGTPAS